MTFLVAKTMRGHTYYSLAKSYRENGKTKQRIVQYIGTKERMLQLLMSGGLTLEEIKVQEVRDYGAPLAVKWICEKLDLAGTITRHAAKTPGIGLSVGKLVEIMVINRVLDPQSKRQLPHWYASTALEDHRGTNGESVRAEDLTTETLYRALDYLDERTIEGIEKELVKRALEWLNERPSLIYYDITSTYFEGGKCTLALLGYSRDHRPDKQQIVVGLAVTRGKSIPLRHWVYAGNRTDKTTTTGALGVLAEQFPDRLIMVIMDRGMGSPNVIEELDAAHHGYLMGLDAKQKTLEQLIDEIDGREPLDLIVRGKPYTAWELAIEENGRNKRIVLVKTSQKEENDLKGIDEALTKAEERIDQFHNVIDAREYSKATLAEKASKAWNAIKKYYDRCTVVVNGRPVHVFDRSERKINRAKKCAGFYALLSSDPELPAKSAMEMYIDKNEVETDFRTMKTDLGLRPIRHWKVNRVRAHVFTCVLALLISRVMNDYLRKRRLRQSVGNVLSVLDGVKVAALSAKGRTEKKLVERTKEQVKLLNLFEIPIF